MVSVQVIEHRLRDVLLGDLQNPRGHGTGHPTVGVPVETEFGPDG